LLFPEKRLAPPAAERRKCLGAKGLAKRKRQAKQFRERPETARFEPRKMAPQRGKTNRKI
jgi:hypothetical protein